MVIDGRVSPGVRCPDGDAAGSISTQHVQPPLCSEIACMDREHLWLAIAQLHGITGISPLIDVEGGQRSDFYQAVTGLEVKAVFHIGSRFYLI